MRAIHLSVGTANTIVRNVGVYYATDEALLHEAHSQDYFIEADAQMLAKLRDLFQLAERHRGA